MKLTKEQTDRVNELAEEFGGRITPDQVVDDARDPDSPLHGLFTWDTDAAAAAHWRDTARAIISSVRVVINTTTTRVASVAYVRDPNAAAKEQGYVSVAQLRTDADSAREAVVNEISRAASAVARAREIARALDMSEEFDATLDELDALKSRFVPLQQQAQEPATVN